MRLTGRPTYEFEPVVDDGGGGVSVGGAPEKATYSRFIGTRPPAWTPVCLLPSAPSRLEVPPAGVPPPSARRVAPDR